MLFEGPQTGLHNKATFTVWFLKVQLGVLVVQQLLASLHQLHNISKTRINNRITTGLILVEFSITCRLGYLVLSRANSLNISQFSPNC